MKKKILSLVTIVAMAFSTMSTFMVSHAEVAKPTIKYVFDFVDNGATFDDSYDAYWDYEDLEGAPVYDITLTITGFEKKASIKEDSTTVAYSGAIIDGIEGVAAELETSKEYMILAETKNWTNGTAVVGSDIEKNKLAYSWGGAKSSEYIKTPDTVLATWTIMATDGSAITDLKISEHEDANIKTRFAEVYDGTDKVGETSVYATSNVFVGYGTVQDAYTGNAEMPQAGADMVNPATGNTEKTIVSRFTFDNAVTAPKMEITLNGDEETREYDSSYFPANVMGGSVKILAILRYASNVASTGDVFKMILTDGDTEIGTATYVVK